MNESVRNNGRASGYFKTVLTGFVLLFGFQFAHALPGPVFDNGSPQSLTVCANSAAGSINALLTASEAGGFTLTWTVTSAPSHGIAAGFPATAASGSHISPVGTTYTPTPGYSGTDAFTVQVSDGTNTSTTVINVTINPLPPAIVGTLSVCVGSNTTLTDTLPGIWASSNSLQASVGSSTGIVTGVAGPSTPTITYTLPATGCSITAVLTVNPLPGAITGTANVCVGSTTTLSDAGGGTWSSSNILQASVGSSSGIVTGVFGPSTPTITYTLPVTACSVTKQVTVNPLPGAIIGTLSVCVGSTTNLTDAGGGTWLSSNVLQATVGSSSGVVTGVAAGNPTITYTLGTGCFTTAIATVNPLPSAITGTPNVCVGATATLTDAGGGSWASSNTFLATVGAGSGIVTGVAGPSNPVITYTLPTGCITTIVATVNPLPTVPAAIGGGPFLICVGNTTSLTDGTFGGTWSSVTPAVATISGTGVVTGVSGGTSVISYTISTPTCGSAAATKTVTVNAPTGTVTGASTVCVGSTTTLTGAPGGGTWTSSAPGTATVGGTGIVTGVAAGFVNITYTYTAGCTFIFPMTVNPLPGAITGTLTVCRTATTTLSDGGGGTWSSAAPGTATVVAGTGVVTGVAAGTATIIYTLATGCQASAIVTVNPTPVAISPGSGSVCVAGTITFTDGTFGGLWSSSAPGIASVAGGVVTGVSAGNATISYAQGACAVTVPVTVNPLPAGITPAGPVAICVGSTTTFSDITSPGVWSSSAPGVASVGALSGIVTALSSGTANIIYTLPTGCTATETMTVSVTPVTLSPSSAMVCTGATTTFTDAVGGGLWSTSDPTVATVTGGVVTGVAVGTATITYVIGSCSTSAPVTVNLTPTSGIVSGPSIICPGSTITLSDAGANLPGVWISGNVFVATVVPGTGAVTGVALGGTLISYSVTDICGTAVSTYSVSVTPAVPAGTISGLTLVCAGSYTAMVDTVTGGTWSVTNGNATISSGGLLTGITPGIDTVVYSVSSGCVPTSATHVVSIGTFLTAGSITGPSGVCTGSSITLSDPAPLGVWSNSNSSASVSGGVVTGLTAGVDTISYTVTSGCGVASASQVITVTASPTAGSITGPVLMCAGMVANYTDAVGGGIWSVTNPTGSITPGGVFTASATGTDTISYTVSNSCGTAVATTAVTIGPSISAGAITGAGPVCAGSSLLLSDAAPGGVWSASNGNATVSGGTVTGVTAGIDTILYTVTGSCGSVSATAAITVVPLPFAGTISGPASVCAGASVTLTDPAPFGFWSAANTSAAVSGGIVTGVSAGLDVISYTVSNMCGTAFATSPITVSIMPTAGVIFGASTVCVGASVTLTDPVTGGVWSSSNADATVSGGFVSGIVAGADTIKYTVTNSCGTAFTTQPLTVNPLPVSGVITGASAVCVGAAITLSDLTSGGSWSASNANAAVSGGVVTGVAAGIDTIAYSVTNICGTASALQAVTVNPLASAGTITGPSVACVGSGTLLSDGIPGGTWSASNANATISGTGMVTGVTAGTDTVAYTVTTACGAAVANAIITVSAAPAAGAITGASTVCKSASITLTDTTPGGTWTSSNARATVAAGIVTGVSAGQDTIKYTVSNACGSAVASKPITVTQVPNPGTISGASSICSELSVTLSDATPGGAWSSSNSSIASVTGLGLVSGLAPGSVTISYTVSNGCGARSATHAITVLPADQCNASVKGTPNASPEIRVFPNPSKGVFSMNLVSDNDEVVRVVVSNVIGNKIKEFTTVTNRATEVELNHAAGIYLLSVYTTSGKYVVKVIVE